MVELKPLVAVNILTEYLGDNQLTRTVKRAVNRKIRHEFRVFVKNCQ